MASITQTKLRRAQFRMGQSKHLASNGKKIVVPRIIGYKPAQARSLVQNPFTKGIRALRKVPSIRDFAVISIGQGINWLKQGKRVEAPNSPQRQIIHRFMNKKQ